MRQTIEIPKQPPPFRKLCEKCWENWYTPPEENQCNSCQNIADNPMASQLAASGAQSQYGNFPVQDNP